MTQARLCLPPLQTVRDLLKLYGLRAIKQLSQNFLLDQRITDKIVKAAGKLERSEVLEVGPGPGSITRSILYRKPSRLLLIERDERFQPTLEMLSDAASCPVEIMYSDILRVNMECLFSSEYLTPWTDHPPNIYIIGNLPFSVSTPLIIKWIKEISQRTSAWRYGRVRMTLTFQKEVAERLTAPILSKQRCRLSVMAQNWCHVEHMFNISGSKVGQEKLLKEDITAVSLFSDLAIRLSFPGARQQSQREHVLEPKSPNGKAFIPKPEVDVGVVRFVPLLEPIINMPFNVVEKVAASLFSGKQKYISKSLGTLFPEGVREEFVEKLLKDSDILPTTRAVQITVPELGRIVHSYHVIIQNKPSLAKYNFRGSSNQSVDIEM